MQTNHLIVHRNMCHTRSVERLWSRQSTLVDSHHSIYRMSCGLPQAKDRYSLGLLGASPGSLKTKYASYLTLPTAQSLFALTLLVHERTKVICSL